MKTILLLTLLFFNLNEPFSQTNLSFEDWISHGTYSDPSGWRTSNQFVDFGTNVSCLKSPPHWGNFSLGITSIYLPSLDTLSGFVLQQFEYTQRAKSVSLYYQYNSKQYDSASLVVLFFKGYTQDTNNIIGQSILYLTPQNNWVLKRADIIWKNSLIPDTASLSIFTLDRNKKDTIFVDDISLSIWNVDINQAESSYPNSFVNSRNELVLSQTLQNNLCNVQIKNILGQTVFEDSTLSGSVDLNQLPNGFYFYEINIGNGSLLIGKFFK